MAGLLNIKTRLLILTILVIFITYFIYVRYRRELVIKGTPENWQIMAYMRGGKYDGEYMLIAEHKLTYWALYSEGKLMKVYFSPRYPSFETEVLGTKLQINWDHARHTYIVDSNQLFGLAPSVNSFLEKPRFWLHYVGSELGAKSKELYSLLDPKLRHIYTIEYSPDFYGMGFKLDLIKHSGQKSGAASWQPIGKMLNGVSSHYVETEEERRFNKVFDCYGFSCSSTECGKSCVHRATNKKVLFPVDAELELQKLHALYFDLVLTPSHN